MVTGVGLALALAGLSPIVITVGGAMRLLTVAIGGLKQLRSC